MASTGGKMIEITFDPTDLKGMRNLMDKYGASGNHYYGHNENDEDVVGNIYSDHIEVVTFQKNHWVRINTYHTDGTREETFDGKW